MPSLPMKDDGGEPIGPMSLSQGSFDDHRMRSDSELAGIRDSESPVALSGCRGLCVLNVFQSINTLIFMKSFIE